MVKFINKMAYRQASFRKTAGMDNGNALSLELLLATQLEWNYKQLAMGVDGEDRRKGLAFTCMGATAENRKNPERQGSRDYPGPGRIQGQSPVQGARM